jgi:hypothetical protein
MPDMSVVSEREWKIMNEPVQGWRLEQLLCAGYPLRQAQVLTGRSDVDLHVAVMLLQRGCPLETALRILL